MAIISAVFPDFLCCKLTFAPILMYDLITMRAPLAAANISGVPPEASKSLMLVSFKKLDCASVGMAVGADVSVVFLTAPRICAAACEASASEIDAPMSLKLEGAAAPAPGTGTGTGTGSGVVSVISVSVSVSVVVSVVVIVVEEVKEEEVEEEEEEEEEMIEDVVE